MKKLITAAILISSFQFQASCLATETELTYLEELLAQISEIPDRKLGLSGQEQAYIERIKNYQELAVPYLIELLSHEDIDVAEIAAAALAGCSPIDAKHLPKIIEGLDRGIGWLPAALGKINSEDASKEAVKRYLEASSSPHNQEAVAVQQQGERAIPFLVQALHDNQTEDDETIELIGYAFGEMDPDSQVKSAQALKTILDNSNSSDELLRKALATITFLQDTGLILEPDLIALYQTKPNLKEHIDSALIGIGSAESGRIFSNELNESPNPYLLRDIASSGISAHGAGPAIQKLLFSSDWNTCRDAARTLGFIRYNEAISDLTNLLQNTNDVVLTWIACQSLGRLQAESSCPELEKTVQTHWHPSVREEAQQALNNIKNSTSYTSRHHKHNFPFEFYDYMHFGIDNQDLGNLPDSKELNASYASPAELKALTYTIEEPFYDGQSVQHKTTQKTPSIALQVEAGWLTGRDHGEWGGELFFIGTDGTKLCLLNENVNAIYKLGSKHIALTGLAHLGGNYGMVYEVAQNEAGEWHASPWLGLPGAPNDSRQLNAKEIAIETQGGGNVILSENGSFTMIDPPSM